MAIYAYIFLAEENCLIDSNNAKKKKDRNNIQYDKPSTKVL
jgi:hypothetical protein